MQGKIKHKPQLDMFKIQLKELVSQEHSLIVLSHKIDWSSIDKEFEQYYSKEVEKEIKEAYKIDK